MIAADLHAKAFQAYTWKNIRDALRASDRRFGHNGRITGRHLMFELSLKETKALLLRSGVAPKKKDVEAALRMLIYVENGRNDKNEWALPNNVFYRAKRIFDASDDLLAVLSDAGILEPTDEYTRQELSYWNITEKGEALIRQKALRQITPQEAAGKLLKALHQVKEHNADPEKTFPVSRVYLFGSLLKGNQGKVSDVDLILSKNRRMDGLDIDAWSQREMERVRTERPGAASRWDIYFDSTCYTADKRLRASSPYIAIDPEGTLSWLTERGEPFALIYADDKLVGCSSQISADEILCARQNRIELAQKIGCPELADFS